MARPLDGHPLAAQFAALPLELQGRLMRFVDIVDSMDEQQKTETIQALGALAVAPVLAERPFVRALVQQCSYVAVWAGVLEEQADIEAAVDRLTGESDG